MTAEKIALLVPDVADDGVAITLYFLPLCGLIVGRRREMGSLRLHNHTLPYGIAGVAQILFGGRARRFLAPGDKENFDAGAACHQIDVHGRFKRRIDPEPFPSDLSARA